jgi:hypothetical protein
MSCISIISCFSYSDNRKYKFSPEHLRSDLRRIISFSHNQTGCTLGNTYIITDIQPREKIQKELLENFVIQVNEYLNISSKYSGLKPLEWLYNICIQISDDLYVRITNMILPIIGTSNIIEFCSLFANLIVITDKSHYEKVLDRIFNKPMTNLFFYYTGHCIKMLSEIYILVPKNQKVEYYNRKDLQDKIFSVLNNVNSFIILDCCNGNILEFPYKLIFNKDTDDLYLCNNNYIKNTHIYLSSTRNNQTCGFHKYGGSLFTYYLMEFLKSQNRKIAYLREVDEKIQEYRKFNEKNPQNMFIGLSKDNITHLPSWLFKGNRIKLMEQGD